jgi:sec-independent protein translocase protein TatA
MLGLSTTELLLIVLAVVLLFGASRLPQLAKSLGQSRKAFREGMHEAEEEENTRASRQINSGAASPSVASFTDEEVVAEMQRRAESKSETTQNI